MSQKLCRVEQVATARLRKQLDAGVFPLAARALVVGYYGALYGWQDWAANAS